MLIYLWNFCKCALLKITALVWNAFKLVQGEQQQQMNTISTVKSKVKVSMAVEVWTDVFGFITRIELANTVSLTNRHIYQICWPRLHGNRVMAHEVGWMIIANRDDGSAIMRRGDETIVPFANSPPPGYITQFRRIQINFLNDQVLAFINVIAPLLTKTGVDLHCLIHMENLDAQQRDYINKLVEIFREDLIRIVTKLANIPFLPDMDNRKSQLYKLHVDEDTDIPFLMNMLATPRPDGQQRVIHVYAPGGRLAMRILNAIRQDFRNSIQPLPQPFYIICHCYLMNFDDLPPRSEEENAQTGETLIMLSGEDPEYVEIYRHPKGEHEKWAEDARQRKPWSPSTSTILEVYECLRQWTD